MTEEKMFPPEILAAMPGLGEADGDCAEKVKVHVKIFNPFGTGTWYLTEYSPERRVFYGLCSLDCAELGTVSQDELLSVRTMFGGLERDLHLADDFNLSMAMEREEALNAG